MSARGYALHSVRPQLLFILSTGWKTFSLRRMRKSVSGATAAPPSGFWVLMCHFKWKLGFSPSKPYELRHISYQITGSDELSTYTIYLSIYLSIDLTISGARQRRDKSIWTTSLNVLVCFKWSPHSWVLSVQGAAEFEKEGKRRGRLWQGESVHFSVRRACARSRG